MSKQASFNGPVAPLSAPYTMKEIVAHNNASVLKLQFLDVAHPEYISLADQFTSKWQHPKPVTGVEVVDVIKIEVGSFPVCNMYRS